MNWKYAFFLLLMAFLIINCSQTKDIPQISSRIASLDDIQSFHPEMTIKIGWVPYEGQTLVRTNKNEWRVVPHEDGDKVGALPTMIIEYPDSGESIMIDMDIKNELLGKLIKHSAMTMVPISRPFTQFFEDAKCQSCHPEDVKVDFGYMDNSYPGKKLTDKFDYISQFGE
jgi:hypothetical protein